MSRLLILGFLILAAASSSAQTARIEDVGIHGQYRLGVPVPVRVQLTNPSAESVPISLKFRVSTFGVPNGADVYSESVVLPANSQRVLEVPVRLGTAYNTRYVLDFEARTAAGLLASDRRDLKAATSNGLVLILCLKDQLCRQAEELLTISGDTDERAGKKSHYMFLPSRNPLPDWWAYSAASAIVLALPPSSLTVPQQLALEGYLRQGGVLILPESIIGNSSFLANYRQGEAVGKAEPVGFGLLYRFTGINDQLASFFNGSHLQPDVVQEFPWNTYGVSDGMRYSRSYLALNFHFPGFAWLLWWLSAYIFIVGFLNFWVLNRLDHREWGWVTVPVISILFAVAFYVGSSSHRPKDLQLDEIVIYRLDDVSAVAAMRVGLRVSSPSRSDLTLTLPQNLIWDNPQVSDHNNFDLSIRGNKQMPLGLAVQLGPSQQIPVSLLQWSFADFNFSGLYQFPGTVRRLDATHLVNQTGQSFQKAVYFDKAEIYSLDAVPAGAIIDLTTARHKPRFSANSSSAGLLDSLAYPASSKASSLQDFLEKSAYWNARNSFGRAEFVGISDAPVPEAALPGHSAVHKNYAMTTVSFGAPL